MKKNLMLLRWFLKFTFLKLRDEYSIHDYIRDAFCPEFISAEELDEKEQILRDTPGPVGIKYAYYVGSSVSGIVGAVISIIAVLLPSVLSAAALFLIYNFIYTASSEIVWFASKVFNGMCATGLGLVAAHLYKVIYFNKTSRKSVSIVIFSAVIFIFLPTMAGAEISAFMPFYMIAVVVLGIVMGILHNISEKKRIAKENDPTRVIDPYSKKAIRERDRKIREEEDEMRKERNIIADLKKEIDEKKNKR